MISSAYVADHLRGVWRIAFGGDWRALFDRSISGAFNSLWAIPIAAPFALLAAATTREAAKLQPEFGEALTSIPFLAVAIAQIVKLVLAWASGVGVILALSRFLNARANAIDAVIAFNWSQLLGFLLAAGPMLLFVGIQSVEIFGATLFPAAVINLFVVWRVIRETLPLDIATAVATIAFLLLVELLINAAAGFVLQGFL